MSWENAVIRANALVQFVVMIPVFLVWCAVMLTLFILLQVMGLALGRHKPLAKKKIK